MSCTAASSILGHPAEGAAFGGLGSGLENLLLSSRIEDQRKGRNKSKFSRPDPRILEGGINSHFFRYPISTNESQGGILGRGSAYANRLFRKCRPEEQSARNQACDGVRIGCQQSDPRPGSRRGKVDAEKQQARNQLPANHLPAGKDFCRKDSKAPKVLILDFLVS